MVLDSAYLVSVPYGVRMRFAKDPLVIENSKLTINNFNLYSSKNDELNVHGSVDFADFDHIMTNIRLRAQNYQIIDAKENKQSRVPRYHPPLACQADHGYPTSPRHNPANRTTDQE